MRDGGRVRYVLEVVPNTWPTFLKRAVRDEEEWRNAHTRESGPRPGAKDPELRPTALKANTEDVLDEQSVLSLDALVRSIGVRRSTPIALFLGAGASVTSDVPSAQMCIWEWKRLIFVTNNPGLENQFAELSLEGVRRRIQAWFDCQGTYPAANSAEEYGFYIKQCFPSRTIEEPFSRRKYEKQYHTLVIAYCAILRRQTWFELFGLRTSMAYPLVPRLALSLHLSKSVSIVNNGCFALLVRETCSASLFTVTTVTIN